MRIIRGLLIGIAVVSATAASPDPVNDLYDQIKALDGTQFEGSGVVTKGPAFEINRQVIIAMEGQSYGYLASVVDGRATAKRLDECPGTLDARNISGNETQHRCYTRFKAEYKLLDLGGVGNAGGPTMFLEVWDLDFPNM